MDLIVRVARALPRARAPWLAGAALLIAGALHAEEPAALSPPPSPRAPEASSSAPSPSAPETTTPPTTTDAPPTTTSPPPPTTTDAPPTTTSPPTTDEPVERAPPVRIAVYDLALSGVPTQMGAVVLQALMGEVRKLDRTSAIGMDEIRLLIAMEAERQLTGCDEDSCLSEIAEALGADVVLAGSIARVGDQTFFTLRRLEQAQAQVSAQFSRTLVAQNGEEVLAVLGAAVESLFPERTLRTGQTRGVDPAVAARLAPPPLDPWAFWTAASVAGAAVATTAVAGATLAVRYTQFDALRTAPEARGRDVLAAQADAASAQTLFGVASTASVLAGAGAAAVFFFVDWQGIRASLPPEER